MKARIITLALAVGVFVGTWSTVAQAAIYKK